MATGGFGFGCTRLGWWPYHRRARVDGGWVRRAEVAPVPVERSGLEMPRAWGSAVVIVALSVVVYVGASRLEERGRQRML